MQSACARGSTLPRLAMACLLGAFAVGPSLVSTPALAQDKAAIDKARDQFHQAIAAETAGNWPGALNLLREVANVKMTPQVRYNIALCEEHLGQLVAALGDYELALVDAQAVTADDVTSVVPQRIEALRARIPTVTLQKSGFAHTATVLLDGVKIGAAVAGTPMPIDPGAHVVDATARGFQAFSASFDIAERETKTVEIVLQPVAAPPPAASSAPSAAILPPAGAQSPTPRSNVVPYIVGGAGLASLAASSVFYLLRSGTMSDLDKVCGANRDDCPKNSETTFNRGKSYTTVANITLAVGVLALGAGTVLYFTNPSKPAALGVAPAAPDTSVGASFVGRF